MKNGMNEFPILNDKEGIPLFYPEVPQAALASVIDTLSGRWIGQGPKVEKFENQFREKFLGGYSPLATGSGTDCLHLSYILAGIEKGDEVITPVFTCTATNIPLLYIGASPVFADCDPLTLNIDVSDIESRITEKTKAIVCVDYGGIPCDYEKLWEICDRHKLILIADAAHSLGTRYKNIPVGQLADFTIFSFQAIKTLTTGDGGLLAIRNPDLLEAAKRLRWFGIDRAAKQGGIWENDIKEIGYKYQMTDIAAAIGISGLENIDETISYRAKLQETYISNLTSERIQIINRRNDSISQICPWLMTVIVDKDRAGLMRKLREHNIESAQVHYRNDRYSIFGTKRRDLPKMDSIEDRYLVLPLHTKMSVESVKFVCTLINSGW